MEPSPGASSSSSPSSSWSLASKSSRASSNICPRPPAIHPGASWAAASSPLCMDSLMDVKHTCPVCQQELFCYHRL
ncbi:lITAF domain-containing protein [Herpailurus yagouaroundi]|uniref:lITAF domain-containing protein n=1 Tax=Herpailurus yagouaroundi TaxID=1608482 RepID=UPI001AD6457A|nr:LITAF domain-containing protein [Puma yagouaroundi]